MLKQTVNRAKIALQNQMWTEIIEKMDIRTEGSFTLAKLYGPACEYWDKLAVHNDDYEPLLMYD